jgi:hypothetical protein
MHHGRHISTSAGFIRRDGIAGMGGNDPGTTPRFTFIFR